MLATLKHPRKAFLGAGAVLLGGCFISAAVGATTIDFNGLSGSDGSPFTSYAESGFTVARLSGSWLVGKNYGNPPPYILFRNPPTTTASVAVTDAGAPFSFRSIDLYSSTTPIPFIFTGLLNGNTVFTVSGTVPNTFGNFATVSNPHGTDRIDTLQVTLSNPSNPNVPNPVGLDNIVVVAPGSAVPEPEGRRQRRAMASPPHSGPAPTPLRPGDDLDPRRRTVSNTGANTLACTSAYQPDPPRRGEESRRHAQCGAIAGAGSALAGSNCERRCASRGARRRSAGARAGSHETRRGGSRIRTLGPPRGTTLF